MVDIFLLMKLELNKKMTTYDWKGNVRELRNIVERLFILSESDQISEKEVVKYSGKK